MLILVQLQARECLEWDSLQGFKTSSVEHLRSGTSDDPSFQSDLKLKYEIADPSSRQWEEGFSDLFVM